MTAAQIAEIAAATAELLELTLDDGPLDLTTTPIALDAGPGSEWTLTLHACEPGTGNDVHLRLGITTAGTRTDLLERHFEIHEMTPWANVHSIDNWLAS